eukprot:Clim_evm2s87 gene=Clim_evmTU2s87
MAVAVNSLFSMNETGEVLLERHFGDVIPRGALDGFHEHLSQAKQPKDVPPVLSAGQYVAVSIFYHNVFHIALVSRECSPVGVIRMLHDYTRVVSSYFGRATEIVFREHLVQCSLILNEMVNMGYPLLMQQDMIRGLIQPPPRDLSSQLKSVTGGRHTRFAQQLPSGYMSATPWRRQGLKYTRNEVFIDVIEELDAIVAPNGQLSACSITGTINVNCKLSGMPDLSLSFTNGQMLSDVSLHPCVRIKKWEDSRVLSFLPPDGGFELASYYMSGDSIPQLPLIVNPMFAVGPEGTTGRVDLQVQSRSPEGKPLEKVKLSVQMPDSVTSMSLNTGTGTCRFDQITRTLTWDIGNVVAGRNLSLSGSFNINLDVASDSDVKSDAPVGTAPARHHRLPFSPCVIADFAVSQTLVSGLNCNKLDIFQERYKAFKGIKYISKAGRVIYRT